MKKSFYTTLFVFLLLTNLACQKTKESKQVFDYQGQELSEEQMRTLFEKELEESANAANATGEVSKINKRELIGKDFYKVSNYGHVDYKGKRYYEFDETKLSADQILDYLDDNPEDRSELLTRIDFINESIVWNDSQEFIQKMMNYFEQETKTAEKDQVNYLKFMRDHFHKVHNHDKIYELTIEDLHEADPNSCQPYLIQALLDNDYEQEAVNWFFKFKNHDYFNGEEYSYKYELVLSLLYVEDETLKRSIREYFLDLVENEKVDESGQILLIKSLWNSQKTTPSQRQLFLSKLEKIDSEKSKALAENIKLNSSRYDDLDLNKNYSENELLAIIGRSWSKEDKMLLKRYHTKHKDRLIKEKGKYRYTLSSIRNAFAQPDYKDVVKVFNEVGIITKRSSNNVEKDYLVQEITSFSTVHLTVPYTTVLSDILKENYPHYLFFGEAGELPVDYVDFVESLAILMKDEGIEIECKQSIVGDIKAETEFTYEVFIGEKGNKKVYKIELENLGDWYTPDPIFFTLNKILADKGSKNRWVLFLDYDLPTYFLMDPVKYKYVMSKLNFEMK